MIPVRKIQEKPYGGRGWPLHATVVHLRVKRLRHWNFGVCQLQN